MKTLRSTPAHSFANAVNRLLSDNGQAYFASYTSEHLATLHGLSNGNAESAAEMVECDALREMADCNPDMLPQAWHEGESYAMHGMPIDCNPYASSSEDAIAFACGWQNFASNN